LKLPEKSKLLICFPLKIPKGRSLNEQIQIYSQQGYSKLWYDGKIIELNIDHQSENLEIIIDRITNENNPENQSRILESLELGFHEGKGRCNIISFNEEGYLLKEFNNLFLKDDIIFEELNLDFFSFNSPYGACENCEGLGKVSGIDSQLVIPNPNLSVYQDAIVCWKG